MLPELHSCDLRVSSGWGRLQLCLSGSQKPPGGLDWRTPKPDQLAQQVLAWLAAPDLSKFLVVSYALLNSNDFDFMHSESLEEIPWKVDLKS